MCVGQSIRSWQKKTSSSSVTHTQEIITTGPDESCFVCLITWLSVNFFFAVFCLTLILESKLLSNSMREWRTQSGMCEILRTVQWHTEIMSTWQMTWALNTSVVLAEPDERSALFKRAFLTYIRGQNSWKKIYWLKLAKIWKSFLGNWTEWRQFCLLLSFL